MSFYREKKIHFYLCVRGKINETPRGGTAPQLTLTKYF